MKKHILSCIPMFGLAVFATVAHAQIPGTSTYQLDFEPHPPSWCAFSVGDAAPSYQGAEFKGFALNVVPAGSGVLPTLSMFHTNVGPCSEQRGLRLLIAFELPTPDWPRDFREYEVLAIVNEKPAQELGVVGSFSFRVERSYYYQYQERFVLALYVDVAEDSEVWSAHAVQFSARRTTGFRDAPQFFRNTPVIDRWGELIALYETLRTSVLAGQDPVATLPLPLPGVR